MSSERKSLLDVRWELGSMQKFRLAEGEAPHYSVSIREAGAMPVRVVAKLDFGYGKATDEAVAKHIVDTHNGYARLLEFVKKVSQDVRAPATALEAAMVVRDVESDASKGSP